MYIRVTRGHFEPGREEELRPIAEQAVAAARQLPGCRSHLIALDRGADRLVAVSTWDSQEQAEAIGQLRASAEAAGVQFDPAEMYEVIATT